MRRLPIGQLHLHEPPLLSASQREVVERCHEQILILSGYDDPVVIATDIDAATGGVHGYVAPYSWSMAGEQLPELGLLLLASVSLVVDGEALWQLRGPGVRVNVGHWSVSAAGGVDPGESMRHAAARELHEELGVAVADEALEEIGLFHHGSVVRAAYSLRLDQRPQMSVNANEVAAVRWSIDAPGPSSELSVLLQALALN